MSSYYKPNKTYGLFDPESRQPFTISRSGIDSYIKCQRCFYMDKRLGTGQPPGYPFTLNSAVDKLLKKEFDIHRAKGTPHPLMKEYGLDAVPFDDPRMDEWRDALKRGIKYFDPALNMIIRGGVDDVWVNPQGELIIVDYKATSKTTEVNLDAEWQDGYKRQMEIYQWLFRKNGFKVSPTGYFVYCNGNADAEAFDAKLEFDIKLIPYTGDPSWVDETVKNLHQCLEGEKLPEASADCDFCAYFTTRAQKEDAAGPRKTTQKGTLL